MGRFGGEFHVACVLGESGVALPLPFQERGEWVLLAPHRSGERSSKRTGQRDFREKCGLSCSNSRPPSHPCPRMQLDRSTVRDWEIDMCPWSLGDEWHWCLLPTWRILEARGCLERSWKAGRGERTAVELPALSHEVLQGCVYLPWPSWMLHCTLLHSWIILDLALVSLLVDIIVWGRSR